MQKSAPAGIMEASAKKRVVLPVVAAGEAEAEAEASAEATSSRSRSQHNSGSACPILLLHLTLRCLSTHPAFLATHSSHSHSHSYTQNLTVPGGRFFLHCLNALSLRPFRAKKFPLARFPFSSHFKGGLSQLAFSSSHPSFLISGIRCPSSPAP